MKKILTYREFQQKLQDDPKWWPRQERKMAIAGLVDFLVCAGFTVGTLWLCIRFT